MASTLPLSLLNSGGVTFSYRDGTTGNIASDARRMYDHIIFAKVGTFPFNGLTDAQAKHIISASRLANDELEDIWQRTETIDAPGLPDGHWTLLETYVILHFIQISEGLSPAQMALQFTGSAPSEAKYIIRRKSIYAEAGRATDHDAMPTPSTPAPPTAFLRRSVSNDTVVTGMTGLRFNEASSDRDNVSLSQPGLEALEPRHLGGNEISGHVSSVRTDTTFGAQKLARLIQSRCPEVQISPKIERSRLTTVESSVVDISVAHDILVRIRRQDPKFRDQPKTLDKIFKSKKANQMAADSRTWTFESHELSQALREVVGASGNVGVAKALISMGADVNEFKSKARRSRVDSMPINYSQIAANRNDVDMVSLLATSRIAPNNLVGALEQSVEQNLPNVVMTLLQHGVDPNARNGSIFTSAIASQNPSLVKLLLRSRSEIRKDSLTRNLPTAVEHGQIEIVSLLVAYGADPDFENALALRRAVQAQRVDLLLAIMKGVQDSARGKIASSVIGEAFSATSSITLSEQRLLIEILLSAGASGDPVAQILVPVVRAGQQSIAQLLVKHRVNLGYNNGEALRIAVTAKNPNMLSTLLLGKVKEEVTSSVVDEIPHTCNDDQFHSRLSLLIEKGAKGVPLSRALVRAVQRKSIKTIGLLLDHGASVEVDGSQPLRMATTGGDTHILNLLLSRGRPSSKSLQVVLPLVADYPLPLRFEMTKSIINAAGQNGIAVSVLNDALLCALSCPPHEFSRFLIQLVDILITAGARVDYQGGTFFRLAAEFGSMELLELLIHKMSQPTSLSPAVPVCMRMKDLKKRQRFVEILIEHGAKGPEVNQALIDAVEETPVNMVLIKSLLEKADFDHLGGRAVLAAMRSTSVGLVDSLVGTGRLSRKACLDALLVLVEPGTKRRQEKLSLLLRADIGQQGLNNALIQEIRGERDCQIVEMLLDQKASCAHDRGKSLELAIFYQDDQILRQLIARRPDHSILNAMVPKAMELKSVLSRRTCLSLLLQGGATGKCMDHALVEEVETPGYRDHQLIRLLVGNGARIDYSDARAIKFAVTSALGVDLLRILVIGTAASAVVAALIPLAMKHQQRHRLPLLQVLFESGARGPHVNTALVSAVSEGVEAQPTIELLLKYGASVNANDAEAIKVAALAGSSSILKCLLSRNPNPEYCDEALNLAMKSLSSNSKVKTADRLQSVRLLTRSKPTDSRAINSALVQAVQEEDYNLIEHLIDSGADPNFEDGRALILATEQLNTRSLHLLVQSKTKPTPQTYSRAFSVMPQGRDRLRSEPGVILSFGSTLIFGGAIGPAVDRMFLIAIGSSHILAAKFVNMVLKCKTVLDANFEHGRSLCVAVAKAHFEVVDHLLLQIPDVLTLRSAFMTIFESKFEEQVLITLAQRFFKHSNGANHVYFRHDEPAENALYQTLHRHGDKPNLLQTLLENGCATDSRFSWEFDNSIGAEDTSALLWFLCQENQSIDILTVNILLERGADPNFRTRRSGVTPLMMAASLPNSDITSRLLEADACPDAQDWGERTPLHYASMANNIKGMDHLLNSGADVNDESLHIAARQLNLPAVSLLLTHHARTDLPGTVHCGGRTPLGELCRVANLSQNPPQLKKTLTLLCKHTKTLEVLTDGRSIVFQALDNDTPLKMATALLTSCHAVKDDLNNDFNIFANGSFRYSPSSYVRHFKCVGPPGFRSLDPSYRCCNIDTCPSPKLERLLRAHGCQYRFWDDAGGANQPRGLCNPPPAITTSITEAEAEYKEQARKARAAAEEAARKEQIQKDLDDAAAAEYRREQVRLKALKEVAAAEIQATKEKAAADAQAIQQLAIEQENKIRRLATVKAGKAEAERQRKLNEAKLDREQARARALEQEEEEKESNLRTERTLRERKNIQIDLKKQEANIQKELLKEERNLVGEKRRLLNDAKGMYREAGLAGVNKVGMGRILGEIEQ